MQRFCDKKGREAWVITEGPQWGEGQSLMEAWALWFASRKGRFKSKYFLVFTKEEEARLTKLALAMNAELGPFAMSMVKQRERLVEMLFSQPITLTYVSATTKKIYDEQAEYRLAIVCDPSFRADWVMA